MPEPKIIYVLQNQYGTQTSLSPVTVKDIQARGAAGELPGRIAWVYDLSLDAILRLLAEPMDPEAVARG